ncbi:MAG: hypothetical protein WBQ73_02230 [Candidatus Babeliales bacterium]
MLVLMIKNFMKDKIMKNKTIKTLQIVMMGLAFVVSAQQVNAIAPAVYPGIAVLGLGVKAMVENQRKKQFVEGVQNYTIKEKCLEGLNSNYQKDIRELIGGIQLNIQFNMAEDEMHDPFLWIRWCFRNIPRHRQQFYLAVSEGMEDISAESTDNDFLNQQESKIESVTSQCKNIDTDLDQWLNTLLDDSIFKGARNDVCSALKDVCYHYQMQKGLKERLKRRLALINGFISNKGVAERMMDEIVETLVSVYKKKQKQD